MTVDASVVARACNSRDAARPSTGRTACRAPGDSAPCATGMNACPFVRTSVSPSVRPERANHPARPISTESVHANANAIVNVNANT